MPAFPARRSGPLRARMENRRASPSSARIVTDGQLARSRSAPSAPCSRAGGARSARSSWSSGAIWASSASIIASAIVTCSRAHAASG